MKCPRDGKALVFVDDGNHMRDRCPDCDGMLLDREEIAASLGRREGRALAFDIGRVANLAEGTLACPRDQAKMRILMHRGVELDLCPDCSSLWLDAGELKKVRGAAQGPGGGKKGGGARAAAFAGAAAVAAGAAVAAAPQQQSMVSAVAEVGGEAVAEGAIHLVFEFALEALGALFS